MNQEQVDLKTAADRLGTSVDALRKRIKRGALKGELLNGRQYVWLDRVDGGPAETDTGQPEASQEASQRPDDVIQALIDQLKVKDQQISELHILLQREQARTLPAPKDESTTVHSDSSSPTDEVDRRNSRDLFVGDQENQGNNRNDEVEKRRPWWAFWRG